MLYSGLGVMGCGLSMELGVISTVILASFDLDQIQQNAAYFNTSFLKKRETCKHSYPVCSKTPSTSDA